MVGPGVIQPMLVRVMKRLIEPSGSGWILSWFPKIPRVGGNFGLCWRAADSSDKHGGSEEMRGAGKGGGEGAWEARRQRPSGME